MDYEAIITQLQSQNALLTARCEQYAQAYEYLQEQLLELRRKVFGKSSERFLDPENRQQSLLEDTATLFAATDANCDKPDEPAIYVSPYSRKKKSKTDKVLPRRIEIITLSEADMECACGACKTVIRYENML